MDEEIQKTEAGRKIPETDLLAELMVIYRRLGPAGPLALIAASLPAVGGFVLLYFIPTVGPWLQAQGGAGIGIYVAAFSVLAGLALLPTWVQAVLGGQAFGFFTGGLAAISGFAGASAVGYLVARRASGNRAIELIDEKPKWRAVYRALLGSGQFKSLLLVTLLRVPPNSPFAITNLVLSATKVPVLVYFVGTIVGMAPRTLAAAYIGSTLTEWGGKSPYQKWITVIGIVAMVIVIAIIGAIAKRALDKLTSAESEDQTAPLT